MGPDGNELRRQVREQQQEARNDVVKAVLEACTGLKRLWLDDWECVELIRSVKDDGRTGY